MKDSGMTTIIIQDVEEPIDLLRIARYMLGVLEQGIAHEYTAPGTTYITLDGQPPRLDVCQLEEFVDMDGDYTCHIWYHRTGCSCVYDAAMTDPRNEILVDATRHDGPVPYVPCPAQGTHAQLTECWMCWSDVHRAAILPEWALAA